VCVNGNQLQFLAIITGSSFQLTYKKVSNFDEQVCHRITKTPRGVLPSFHFFKQEITAKIASGFKYVQGSCHVTVIYKSHENCTEIAAG